MQTILAVAPTPWLADQLKALDRREYEVVFADRPEAALELVSRTSPAKVVVSAAGKRMGPAATLCRKLAKRAPGTARPKIVLVGAEADRPTMEAHSRLKGRADAYVVEEDSGETDGSSLRGTLAALDGAPRPLPLPWVATGAPARVSWMLPAASLLLAANLARDGDRVVPLVLAAAGAFMLLRNVLLVRTHRGTNSAT